MTNMINALSRRLAVLFMLVLGTVGVGQMAMAADNQLTGMRLGMIELNGAPALRIVIETRQPATAKLLLLDEPWRLVVDSPGLNWDIAELQSAGALSSGPASAYRFGHPEPGTGRLVIEMTAPASPERAFTLPPRDKGGYRLVIDLVDKGPTRFKLAQRSLQKMGIPLHQQATGRPKTHLLIGQKCANPPASKCQWPAQFHGPPSWTGNGLLPLMPDMGAKTPGRWDKEGQKKRTLPWRLPNSWRQI